MKYELPSTIESEKVVIGSVLANPALLPDVIETISADDFFDDGHKVIMTSVINRFAQGQSNDPILVSSELDSNKEFIKLGGYNYLTQLINTHKKTSITDFIAEIKKKSVLRTRIKLYSEGQLSILEAKNTDAVVRKIDNDLLLLNNDTDKKSLQHVATFSEKSLRRAFQASLDGNTCTGVPSGLVQLDNLTAGFQNSDLIVVAGKSSHGKTSLVTSMVCNLIRFKPTVNTAIFSLEMTKEQLNNRFLADLSSVDGQNIRKGTLSTKEWVRLVRSQRLIDSTSLYVDDESGITPVKIRAKIESLSLRDCTPDLVVIDYMQLMSSDVKKENRYQEVSHISTSLKHLAKDINRPIIVLSQVSRDSDKNADRRPNMNQLRESGRITEDADVILMLYREEVYNRTDETYGLSELILEKQRNGPTDTVYSAFIKQFNRFENIEIGN